MTLVQWFSLGIVGIVLALFVLRPLITGLFKPSEMPAGGGVAALPGGDAAAMAGQLSHSGPAEIAAARHAGGGGLAIGGPGQRVGEIVDSNPEEAAGIIRNWMTEGAA
jgi:flagellar biosynthesis/type III secretory pathway M-ring protein FliF/YscJ